MGLLSASENTVTILERAIVSKALVTPATKPGLARAGALAQTHMQMCIDSLSR